MNQDEMFEHYLDIGVIIKTPDEQYVLGPNAQILAPEFYESWMADINEDLLDLYKKGLIGVEYNENLEAVFFVTELGKSLTTSN